MDKEELEDIIQEYQNLEIQEEKHDFLERQKELVLSQDETENLETLKNIKPTFPTQPIFFDFYVSFRLGLHISSNKCRF